MLLANPDTLLWGGRNSRAARCTLAQCCWGSGSAAAVLATAPFLDSTIQVLNKGLLESVVRAKDCLEYGGQHYVSSLFRGGRGEELMKLFKKNRILILSCKYLKG